MPAPLLSREEILERLLAVFRARGYQGTSMSIISKETGLGKASLYHHFPGGKEEMVSEVLKFVDGLLEENIITPLTASGQPNKKLEEMINNVDFFYAGGEKACLLDSLSLSADTDVVSDKLNEQMKSWIKAMEQVSKESGVEKKEARERAEEAMAAIQGALIVARTTGNKKIFSRALKRLPEQLLG